MIDAWPNQTWVPDSCCLPADHYLDCGKTGNANQFYMSGCYNQIHMWFVQRLHIVGVVGLLVAFIQVGGIVILNGQVPNLVFVTVIWIDIINASVLHRQA